MPGQGLVSVIIPTKNEQNNILRCLKSVKNQRCKGRVEVFVVDNFSTDKTVKLAQDFLDKNSRAFARCEVISAGSERSSQRNIGAELARGHWLLFLDADMAATPETIQCCVELSKSSYYQPIVAIAEQSVGSTFWGQALALEKNCYKDLSWLQAARFFPRQLFKQIGGYDLSLAAGEDWDLTQRFAAIGVPMLLEDKARLIHYEANSSLRELLGKEAYYIKYIDRYARKHPGAFSYQNSFLYRGFIYIRAWGDLVKHPLLTLAFLSYKFVVWMMWRMHKPEPAVGL